ncbi:VWA domain-containing protein [Haloferula sp. A504]|uniref:VWA domain-containing protein n=1 Tax=Haloferula sp. A504 TaxID=3373601 RepID=UPI0031C27D33|nr:VWA domain-containing protein [Verrucomicrobiaceae bacterium E54]
MLSFAHLWLLLLAPLPWLVWKLAPPKPPSRVAVRVPFGRRLEQALGSGSPGTTGGDSRLGLLWPTLVWLFVLLALARPQWIEPPIEQMLPTRDLLLLVDLSGSMDQKDFTNFQGKTVSRLDAVKEILGDFLERRKGDRVGLVVFGDSPFLQAPFSTDLSLSRELLDETAVGMAGPKTALGDAIGLGIHLFDESEAPARTIIALTDGNDTKSQVPPVEAARIAADRGIRIHTVAIGDPTTAGEDKLDRETLDQVALSAGGKSFFAADRDELVGIYAELDRIETREVKTISHRPRRDLFHLPLLAALLTSTLSRLISIRGAHGAETPRRPLRVHPVTGELELS